MPGVVILVTAVGTLKLHWLERE